MKKLLLILLIPVFIYAQQTGTVNQRLHDLETGKLAKSAFVDSFQTQDSLQIIDGTAKVYINPNDNYGLQISRPNDDVGIKIKVNNQKTGWIVFSNEDGTATGEIEFDTDGTTKTFEIGTNEDYPILLRSNGHNTVSISDTNVVVTGYVKADSVLSGTTNLLTAINTKLNSNFYTAIDEQSSPSGTDQIIIVDNGTALKYTNVEDMFGAYFYTGTDSIHYGQDSIVVTHGVGSTPRFVSIQLMSDNFGYRTWVNVIGATTFSVKRNSSVWIETPTTYIKFKWMAYK
jgi:hypothetical protein